MPDEERFLGESYRGCRVAEVKDGFAIIGVLVQQFENKSSGKIRDEESPIEVIYETKEQADSALSLGVEKLGLGHFKPL